MRLTLIVLLLIPVAGAGQSYSYYTHRANKLVGSIQQGGKKLDAKQQAILAAIYDSAFAVGKPQAPDLYNAACANSLIGNLPKAIQFLKKAFESGYDNFDWMYYDRDLTALRYEPGYLSLEKQYKPDSAVYWFDILRQLNASDDVRICDKRISIPDIVFHYSLNDIMYRAGVQLKLTNDSLIDFSNKTLNLCRSRFDNTSHTYNSLQRMSLAELSLDDCSGDLVVERIHTKSLGFYESRDRTNNLNKLTIDSVIVNGIVRLYTHGTEFFCKSSVFNIEVPPNDNFSWGFVWELDYEYVTVRNTTFASSQEERMISPLEFSLNNPKDLFIISSKFTHPTRIVASVGSRLAIQNNSLPPFMEISGLKFPDFDYHVPFSQFNNTKIVLFNYTRDPYEMRGDSVRDFSDAATFDGLTGLYKRLYDYYRARADISSANSVYVILKELEITHLKSMEHRTTEETIRLRLNQLMGFYTNHATSPGKALIISFYIILAFGIFYCFFPSDWDKTSKSKIIADFRLFIEKNEHGYVKPFFMMMKGLLVSLLNALSLSLNAFITLGFGNIPTTGIARYVCVLQGALGWFLLSLFTVALLNQVLL